MKKKSVLCLAAWLFFPALSSWAGTDMATPSPVPASPPSDSFTQAERAPNGYWVPAPPPVPPAYAYYYPAPAYVVAPPPYPYAYYGVPRPYYGPPRPYFYGLRVFFGFHGHF